VDNRGRALIVFVLAAVALTFDYFFAVRHGWFDVHIYWGAVNYWVHDGGSIYDYMIPGDTYGFTYPPFAALTMLPMAIIPWHMVVAVSAVACIVAAVVVLRWLLAPIARREGWPVWFAIAIALCLGAIFEPLRETFLFGQVNVYLLALVALDVLVLIPRGHRWAGTAIGIATAIKLTPGIFILHLLITKRWRAAITAGVAATVATLGAAAVAPDASLVFWTDALWNTDRVGDLAFVSNQSLRGMIARAHPEHPSTLAWLVVVVVVLVIWVVRTRRAAAVGDGPAGLALTGIVGVLISPFTWVHHLVWVAPALVVLLDHALLARGRRRVGWFAYLVVAYGVLCSRIVWGYPSDWHGPVDWFFSSAYVWLSLALLITLPLRERPVPLAAVETAQVATPRAAA
jgi:alpha-1,2-mannosyltransferase